MIQKKCSFSFWVIIVSQVFQIIATLWGTVCNAQPTSIDSLGNLYVIVFDKSGSMLWGENQTRDSKMIGSVVQTMHHRFWKPDIIERFDFKKDRFIFYYSGILSFRSDKKNRDNTLSLHDLNKKQRFDTSFIHQPEAPYDTILCYNDKYQFINFIDSQLAIDNYEYNQSFVSLIRLFSLVKALGQLPATYGVKYNKLYFVTITDDADQNDQWATEYRIVKKYAPAKEAEVKAIMSKYLYNPLNPRSDVSNTGYFIEELDDTTLKPHVSIHEYLTTQAKPEDLQNDQSVSMIQTGRNELFVSPTLTDFRGNSILYYVVDTFILNGESLIANAMFDNGTKFDIQLPDGFWKNDITIKGYLGVLYEDSILGPHYKKVFFTARQQVPTLFYSKVKKDATIVLVTALFMILGFRLLVRPFQKMATVYFGSSRVQLRRGYSYGPVNRWRQRETNFLSCIILENLIVKFLCKKHANITTLVNKSAKSRAWTQNEMELVITSRYKLDMHSMGVTFKEYSFNTDFDEVFATAKSSQLLQSIYKNTVRYKTYKLFDKWNIRRFAFFSWLLKVLSRILRQHYYYITFENACKGDNLSFTSILKERTFTVEFGPYTPLKPKATIANEVETRNIYTLNHYYEQNYPAVDALVAVHFMSDIISVNVLQIDYNLQSGSKNRLRDVNHMFCYNVPITQQSGMLSTKGLNEFVQHLKKYFIDKRSGIRKYKVIVTAQDSAKYNIKNIKTVEYDYQKDNYYIFNITGSAYKSFLFLVETLITDKRKVKPLYSPFVNGHQKEVMTQTPATGSYYLFEGLTPHMLKVKHEGVFCRKLSEDLFSFSTSRQIPIKIDPEIFKIIYGNNSITIKN